MLGGASKYNCREVGASVAKQWANHCWRIAGFLCLLAILGGGATALHGSPSTPDWTVVKCEGRDYLTLENVAQFYGLGVTRASNDFTLRAGARSLRGAVGSNEFYINNLKFILSYPVSEERGQPLVSRMDLTKVIEPVLRPSRIHGAAMIDTVILDPGHGGYDHGATSIWGSEKNYTLDVACRAKDLLLQQGLQVRLTRATDEFIPLEDRVRFANGFHNALFISIHFNSGDSPATGLETYTLAPRGVPSMAADGPSLSDLHLCAGNCCDSENMALATAAHASLVYHLQGYDRGIKRARFVVIRDITIPGVLLEGGFLSSPVDGPKIASAAYRQQLANCVLAAVQNYRAAVGMRPPPPMVTSRALELRKLVESVNGPDMGPSRFNEPSVVTPTSRY